jgi:hypothetical protein
MQNSVVKSECLAWVRGAHVGFALVVDDFFAPFLPQLPFAEVEEALVELVVECERPACDVARSSLALLGPVGFFVRSPVVRSARAFPRCEHSRRADRDRHT